MKYSTFRNIVVVTGLTAAGAIGFGVSRLTASDKHEGQVTAVAPVVPVPTGLPALPAETAPAPAAPVADGLRAVDRDALAILARPVADKIKDATRGRPYKINAYSDDGRRWNRLKVDHDRDEQWDESWTIKADGRIERKLDKRDPAGHKFYRLVDNRAWQPLD